MHTLSAVSFLRSPASYCDRDVETGPLLPSTRSSNSEEVKIPTLLADEHKYPLNGGGLVPHHPDPEKRPSSAASWLAALLYAVVIVLAMGSALKMIGHSGTRQGRCDPVDELVEVSWLR